MNNSRYCEGCGTPLTQRQNRFCSHGCMNRTHGESHRSPEYRAWSGMKTRCCNANRAGYKNYGGRGIRVCARWMRSFENFLSDVGRRPSASHSIERINNDDHYRPGNVKWATREEQAANTRAARVVTLGGKSQTLSAWSREAGIPLSTIRSRIASGWSIPDAVAIPSGMIRPLSAGTANPNHKLSESDVVEIRQLGAGGVNKTLLAKQYGVTSTNIANILTGAAWQCLPLDYPSQGASE